MTWLAGLALVAAVPPGGSAPVYRIVDSAGGAAFQGPQGPPFWSFGVCCTDPGVDWADYRPDNPSYSGFRLFPNGEAWAKDTLGNLRRWGFNSLGGWSDTELLGRYGGDRRLPYFDVLHLGAWFKAPWDDIFSPQADYWADYAAKQQIPKIANDPYLVGYFTDNELAWWDDTLFLHYLEMKPDAPGHRRLIQVLRRFYSDDFARFRHDWITDARSFDALKTLKLRPGGRGKQAINAWTRAMGERYYRLMRDTVRKYDPKRLILGDRYCQYYTLPIVQAAKPYVDVVSTNLGADWNDGSIGHFFLDTLHQVTGKPVIVTEFYMCAMENRSGNHNSSGGFPIVQTQAERARAFAKYVTALASLPYVVGAHWFQYYDEPAKGRGDGENYNMGLVDTAGRPYEELTQAAAALDIPGLRAHPAAPAPRPGAAVPQAPPNPFDGLRDWPRDAGFVAARSPAPLADLYVARDAENLYVGLYAMDYVDEHLYPGDRLPESERAAWRLSLGGMAKPLTVRFMGDRQPARVDDSRVECRQVPGLKFTVMLRIPLSLLGGQSRVALTSHWDSHSRGQAADWQSILVIPR